MFIVTYSLRDLSGILYCIMSKSLSEIAVLRGGKTHFKQSLEEGGEVLHSLTKIGYHPLDVIIDQEGIWTLKGKETDAHAVFTIAHTVVDTTRSKHEQYQHLAKKMNIPLLFSDENTITLDREDMYKILRQQGIKVPDTVVVRASSPIKENIFREIWSKYHVPLLVRPLEGKKHGPSKLVKLFSDLEKTIREYHANGIDTHILTYRKAKMHSIAILPHFRKEKIYSPLIMETVLKGDEIPHKDSHIRPSFEVSQVKKNQITSLGKKVYEALDLTGPATVDIVSFNDNHIVVNVDTNPSLKKDGRFMQALLTTGVDAGHYIHSCVKNEQER